MRPEDLFKPAAPWEGETWVERMDKCASMLYIHGYIPMSVRDKIGQKMNKQITEARKRLK